MQTLKAFQSQGINQKVVYYSGALWGPLHERPIIDRVVSTSTWPVPYYQRIFKAYPVREQKDKVALTWAGCEVHDSHWYWAKKILSRTFKGRQSIEYVENNLKLKSYLLIQSDVNRMAKAYVNDISLFLNCANKENKIILDSVELI